MIRECFKADTGIMFDTEALREVGLDPATLYPVVLDRPPPLSAANAIIKSARDPVSENYEDFAGLTASQSELLKMEEYHELQDALSPVYDQLDLVWWFWKIMEYIPFRQEYLKPDGTWEKSYVMNRGNERRIPKQKNYLVKVHRSVKMRMEATDKDGVKYVPKASFKTAVDLGNIRWVD